MRVKRGDVVLVDYPFTTGGVRVRPALVNQNDRDNARLTNTIIAQISGNTFRVHEANQHSLPPLGGAAEMDRSLSPRHIAELMSCRTIPTT
jgi:mRNA-degrading endonuclease toxin of MazEF toxin-antitoxin module